MRHFPFLIATIGLVTPLCAVAQFTICDPSPIATTVVFERGAVALNLRQREMLATVVTQSSGFPLNYVSLEPKVTATEVPAAERKNLARQRSEYITSFLVASGIERERIVPALTFALTPAAHPPEHLANRTTSVSVFVVDTPGTQKCLQGSER